MAEREKLDFNKAVIMKIFLADPGSFSGLFIELPGAVFAIPSEYHLRSFRDGELNFILRDELVSEKSRLYSFVVALASSSIEHLAQSSDVVDHDILKRFRDQCGLEVSVKRLKTSAPGFESQLELVEAKVNDWLVWTSGDIESFILAWLDTSRRLSC